VKALIWDIVIIQSYHQIDICIAWKVRLARIQIKFNPTVQQSLPLPEIVNSPVHMFVFIFTSAKSAHSARDFESKAIT
jgi:hypothetical protein